MTRSTVFLAFAFALSVLPFSCSVRLRVVLDAPYEINDQKDKQDHDQRSNPDIHAASLAGHSFSQSSRLRNEKLKQRTLR